MTSQDFDRLRSVCEKEGFEINVYNHSVKSVFEIKKIDPFEGVEFVKSSKVYKVTRIDNDKVYLDEGTWVYKVHCKPSTEQSYVEQLKKEAFERFGEIKIGDIFLKPNGQNEMVSPLLTKPNFAYMKESDTFYFGGVDIYRKGSWATKLKERVKVEFSDFNFGIEMGKIPLVEFNFKMNPIGDLNKAGQFLAYQLEAYLNGEIE